MVTDGSMIVTELRKPTWMPSQDRPVQADDHALIQAAMVGALGGASRLPWRISGMPFSDVIIIT